MQKINKDISNLLFQKTLDKPGLFDHTKQQLRDQIVASMNI